MTFLVIIVYNPITLIESIPLLFLKRLNLDLEQNLNPITWRKPMERLKTKIILIIIQRNKLKIYLIKKKGQD